MQRKKSLLVALALSTGLIAGCMGDTAEETESNESTVIQKVADIDLSDAKDGTYTAVSSPHELFGTSEIELTIQDHKITDVKFVGMDKDGKVKDETYGEDKADSSKKKAQVAYQGYQTYPKELVKTQQINRVDAISGATVSYEQFVETATKAIEQAKNK